MVKLGFQVFRLYNLIIRLYNLKPNNLGEFKLPLGVIETIKKGTDITLVSYGSTTNLVWQENESFEVVSQQYLLLPGLQSHKKCSIVFCFSKCFTNCRGSTNGNEYGLFVPFDDKNDYSPFRLFALNISRIRLRSLFSTNSLFKMLFFGQ